MLCVYNLRAGDGVMEDGVVEGGMMEDGVMEDGVMEGGVMEDGVTEDARKLGEGIRGMLQRIGTAGRSF